MPFFPSPNQNQPDATVYRLYNLSIASNVPFSLQLKESNQKPDINLIWEVNPEVVQMVLDNKNGIYSSPYKSNGQSIVTLYQFKNTYIMRCTNAADFYIASDGVTGYLAGEDLFSLAEVFFAGAVTSFLLETRKTPVLHASSVVKDHLAVAFLSNSGNGKSTLAAYLIQAGWSLLTDDILPLDLLQGAVYGCSGYPIMKLFPDQAKFLCEDIGKLKPVSEGSSKLRVWVGEDGKGSFCQQDQPLSRIYILSRQDPAVWGTRVEISPISPRDGVIELLRYSFSARVVDALNLRKDRFDFFSQVVQKIPLRRITYPSGIEFLPAVEDAIQKDLLSVEPV